MADWFYSRFAGAISGFAFAAAFGGKLFLGALAGATFAAMLDFTWQKVRGAPHTTE